MSKYFTKSQIEEIRRQLATLGVRDTDLPDVETMTGDELVAIVQDGENKKVSIKDLFSDNISPDIISHLKDGKSAYQIAVDHGFQGSEEDWLLSLQGATTPADTNNLGGIKLGYPTNGKNYPVMLDSRYRAYVNVPWEKGEGGGGGGTTAGGYYELIFTATSTSTPPSLPANQATIPSGGWSHSVDLSDNGKIIWMADRLVTDTVGDWMGPWIISGAAGLDGVDGDKIEFVYALTADPSTNPSDPTTDTPSSESPVTDKAVDGFIPYGWTNHPSSVTSSLRAEWVSYRFKVFSHNDPDGTWTAFSAASLWSVYGQNGRDGDGIEYIFYAGTTLPSGDLPSSWETDSDFQDPEYIRADSGWTDDPVDLEDEQSGYGMGTKQWVCTRKKYADVTPHATYGTEPYWHEYSDPALWSYYAQDGDAGTGIVADLLPDSMAIPLLESGYNKSYTATTDAVLYNGVAAVAGASASLVSVLGSDGTNYTNRGWVTISGNTVTVSIAAESIDLSTITLKVTVNVSGTISSETVTRQAVLSIMGINFGTDGVSYTLDCGYAAVRKLTNSTILNQYSPTNLRPVLVEVTGTYAIQRYTPADLLAPSCPLTGFSIWYQLDDGNLTKLTTESFAVSNRLVPTNNEIIVYLMYNAGSGESIVLQEHIHILPDAEDGGHYVQAFRTYDGRGIPSAPSTYPLPSGGAWQSSAPNEGPVWMTECFVNSKNQMVGTWMTPWCISGSNGLNGYDGIEYEYIYTRTDDTDPENVPDPNTNVRDDGYTYPDPKTIDDFVPQYWTDDAEGIEVGTGENTVEWQSHRCKTGSRNGIGGSWTEFSDPIVWSAAGLTGTDGAGVEYIYYAGTVPPSVDPSTWDDKTSDFQNTREYIPSNVTSWVDDPVDLSTAAQGTKQWVSIRKKYYDSTDTEPWNTVRWHRYSSPKLWSSVGRDAVINGVHADFDNDMLAVGLDSNGMNYALNRSITATVYYNGEALSASSVAVTNITVTDSNGNSYDEEGWVVSPYDDTEIRVNIPAGSIDLSETTLTAQIDFEATVTVGGSSTVFTTTGHIQIIGVSFGEDGASYDMITSTRTIWNRAGENNIPSEVNVSITKVVGLDNITSYTVQQLIQADPNFSFTYQKDEDTAQPVALTTSSISTVNVDSYLIVRMYYKNYLVDMETIYVGRDGTDGKNGIRLDLDNENDSILFDKEGNNLSGDVTSTATLYDGYEDKSSEASNWSIESTGCHATLSNRTITVDAFTPGTTSGSVRISCVYKSRTYSAVLSVKKIVGDTKYDLRVTPKDAVFFNTTTGEISSSTIRVEVWRTAANENGGITTEKRITIPNGYNLLVDGTSVTSSYSSGYTIPLSSGTLAQKEKYTISLVYLPGSSLVDEETVYVAKFANGTDGQNGTQAVCPFVGEYDPNKAYYGSYNRTDIVYYPNNGKYYIAKPTAPSSPFIGKDPVEDVAGEHKYWNEFEGNYESLATGFLFAERLVAHRLETVDEDGKGITAHGNELVATDNTSTVRVQISGDPVSIDANQAISYGTTRTTVSGGISSNTVSASVCSVDVPICTFNVPSNGTQVNIPDLNVWVESNKQRSTEILVCHGSNNSYTDLVLMVSTVNNPVSSRYNTYTVGARTTTSLAAGVYKIIVRVSWSIPADPDNLKKVYDQYSVGDNTLSKVLVGGTDNHVIMIGSNGMSIQLGHNSRAVFALDSNNKPFIALENYRAVDQSIYGIKIYDGNIFVKEAEDDAYYTLKAYINDVIN